MVKIVKKQKTLRWQGCGEEHSGGNINRYTLLGGKFEVYIPNFKMYIIFTPVIPLPGDYPKEMMRQACKDTCK